MIDLRHRPRDRAAAPVAFPGGGAARARYDQTRVSGRRPWCREPAIEVLRARVTTRRAFRDAGWGSLGAQPTRVATYASESIRASHSEASATRTRTSQPPPYGSELIGWGSSSSASFTATISPDSGAITSDTAFTDSTSAYGSSLRTRVPTAGGWKNTTSPSASCA